MLQRKEISEQGMGSGVLGVGREGKTSLSRQQGRPTEKMKTEET